MSTDKMDRNVLLILVWEQFENHPDCLDGPEHWDSHPCRPFDSDFLYAQFDSREDWQSLIRTINGINCLLLMHDFRSWDEDQRHAVVGALAVAGGFFQTGLEKLESEESPERN